MKNRNFCGVIGRTSSNELSGMIERLNFNNLYQANIHEFDEAKFVGMSSPKIDILNKSKEVFSSNTFQVISSALFSNIPELSSKLECSKFA